MDALVGISGRRGSVSSPGISSNIEEWNNRAQSVGRDLSPHGHKKGNKICMPECTPATALCYKGGRYHYLVSHAVWKD
jgi:hypothetical protein